MGVGAKWPYAVAKGLLPYHRPGSCIKRELEKWKREAAF